MKHMLHLISNETLQKLGSTFYSPHIFFIQRVIKPWQWQPRKATTGGVQGQAELGAGQPHLADGRGSGLDGL